MDIFTDLFTPKALLASIINQPYIPGQTARFFETEGIPGTTFEIEKQPTNSPAAMTATPRGKPSKVATLERRESVTFTTAHYREDAAVYADEVLNVRAPGMTTARDLVARKRDDKLRLLRQKLDLTHEYLRVSCVNSATNDLGTSPAAEAIAFAVNDTADVARKLIFTKIIQPMETALGGTPYSGLVALCNDTVWEALIVSKTIRETYLNQVAADTLRGSTTEAFMYGNVLWERYRGTAAINITSGQAKVIPLGVPGLFKQVFAPADTMDSVGTGAVGTPYHLSSYMIDGGNRGWYLEAQTNPAMVCTRPAAILTIDLS